MRTNAAALPKAQGGVAESKGLGTARSEEDVCTHTVQRGFSEKPDKPSANRQLTPQRARRLKGEKLRKQILQVQMHRAAPSGRGERRAA